MNRRVRKALNEEAKAMGRLCHLIDYAELAEDVIVVVYRTEPYTFHPPENETGSQTEIRTAMYAGSRSMGSTTIRTEWTP